MNDDDPCPCGAGDYGDCCAPFHRGEEWAPTAEQLMRSRYSAFALGLSDYLWRTWHPHTRPASVDTKGTSWTGLEIIDVVDGGESDAEGIVEFEASYRAGHHTGVVRERSTFSRRAGHWMYVEDV